jgi:hypothetical protein
MIRSSLDRTRLAFLSLVIMVHPSPSGEILWQMIVPAP